VSPLPFPVQLYRAALLEADRILASGALEVDEMLALAATLEEIREAVQASEWVDDARA
jgi:hypothetical protein